MDQTFTEFLAKRRSVKADRLTEPAPSDSELQQILTIAARVPDHKKLVPWRFIVIKGAARGQLGEIIAAASQSDAGKPPPSEQRLETERNRLTRAPLVIAVIARLQENPIAPIWEQTLSTGAAAFNLCLAANTLGYATCWLTEWYAYNDNISSALGLEPHEKIAGFIHIGTAMEPPEERARPELNDIVSVWSPS